MRFYSFLSYSLTLTITTLHILGMLKHAPSTTHPNTSTRNTEAKREDYEASIQHSSNIHTGTLSTCFNFWLPISLCPWKAYRSQLIEMRNAQLLREPKEVTFVLPCLDETTCFDYTSSRITQSKLITGLISNSHIFFPKKTHMNRQCQLF